MNMTNAGGGGLIADTMLPTANPLGRSLFFAWTWLCARNTARRSLDHARSLDDRMLEDVGLTRADLRREGTFDHFSN